jgi:arylsulfatase A
VIPKLCMLGLILFFASCTKDLKQQELLKEASTGTATRVKPNIILIIGDDVGREIPTYNGGESYSTPNLDYLAANGKQFSNFFSHPDGPPSRLALFTGLYNYNNWVRFGYLPPSSQTFANMLKNAGYQTCYVGKWQMDGGDTSIRNHGFDKYLTFVPFAPYISGHDQFYRRYKNPYLYQDAHYLSDAEVKGKYSEDMFFNYASKFIDTNKQKPFLLVYSHNLVQKPWVPTPDNAEFAGWDPATDDTTKDDKKYFPDMVAYMDKTIGKLLTKVRNSGIEQKTVILFISDNATYGGIRSVYKGRNVRGAKDSTVFDGINVPMLAYCPARITSGSIDTSLVDMTDFFTSFSELAGVSLAPYLPQNGISFYDNLVGNPADQRSTIYCYWPRDYQQKPDISYVADYNYKLYDSLNGGLFYNIRLDMYEKHPIPNNELTSAEQKIKNDFKKILRQGF